MIDFRCRRCDAVMKSANACEEEQITKPRHKLWQELAGQIGNARKDERDRAKAHKIEQHEAAARDSSTAGQNRVRHHCDLPSI